ncbi:MAG: hypothetical protein KTR24_06880 [Saprospiraceae bacterium]|nr:hypothetical protein [Saprospiraceae bacterium]
MSRLFQWGYDAALAGYRVAIGLAAPFSTKARKWVEGRRKQIIEPRDDRPIWVHCSSLGEFEQGRPIIEMIRDRNEQIPIVLTFFSPSGYEIRESYPLADEVYYLPADHARSARDFVDRIKPRLAIFVKYDFWFHYLDALTIRKLPFLFVATILHPKHFLFRRSLTPLLDKLRQAEVLFVQNPSTKSLLEERGFTNAVVSGDPRIDRVLAIDSGTQLLGDAFREIVVFGSVWLEDLDMVLPWIKDLLVQQDVQVLVAPHDISDKNVKSIMGLTGIKHRHSEWQTDAALPHSMVVDTMGHLSRLYHGATLAYVGGGFSAGLHNILEPAAAGIPIIFGPKYQKFDEAVILVEQKCAFSIRNFSELAEVLELLADAQVRSKIARDLSRFLTISGGATQVVVDWIDQQGFLKDGAAG